MSYCPDLRTLVTEARKINFDLLRYNHSRAVLRLLKQQESTLLSASILLAETVDGDKATVTFINAAAELPDALINVLVATDDGEVDAAFYNGDGTWTWLDGHDVTKPVIAWADMPESPVKPQETGGVE